ncbi:NO-inducible flavohemoprotein [Deefgea salmonis]|uniref:Flavohemoprotein n=1 Tax=Deefgea salmonis TaxID=2875502 RepID=A0ABS8BIC8_9NEIS|nr:NO-inducible flavohemoprotein [Deefgea salmonis]MCB5195483.1 NO-inducible flavohemoprotein [Deefgea salmonis]
MLDLTDRDLVRATAPILKQHGVALTTHFYARMFQHNPELKQIFNEGNQQSGAQQQALAMAVAAYAEHIDNPSVLAPVLTRIANKHISLGIRPEHYPIVGHHLLASIREVLGAAATDELIAAWAAAYGQLADVLIAEEAQLYAAAAFKNGGWTGWRGFVVAKKVVESSEITSFYLRPADGGTVPDYLPGQYISVRMFVPEWQLMQPRQYSLSDAPGQDYLRISVKREQNQQIIGQVSNLLHSTIEVGDVIDVAPPAGDFVLHTERSGPVVLMSGGVGITPMMAMLQHLHATGSARQVSLIHACRNPEVHAFKQQVQQLTAAKANFAATVFYDQADPAASHHLGPIDLAKLADRVILPDADYYLCGPLAFMQAQIKSLQALGVQSERIHAEAFGTGGVSV